MSKRKDRKRVEELYAGVVRSARGPAASGRLAPESPGALEGSSEADPPEAGTPTSGALSHPLEATAGLPPELPQMKKFRFQLLHGWMTQHLAPCRVADVGGGKGLLAYLLQQSGWQATVIDPQPQALPGKYRDPASGRQIRIATGARVPRLDRAFAPELARDFDLLVAMHTHGCLVPLIDAAASYRREAIVLPCCVIHEPIRPPRGVHWLQCVVDYAVHRGLRAAPFRLNFKGQNIGLHLSGPSA